MADTTQFRNYTTRYDPGMGLDLICDALNLGLYIGVDAAADASPTISSAIIKFLQSGIGAVPTDLQTRGRLVVFLTDYATCDGVTESSAGVLNAIAAVTEGGTIVCPAGKSCLINADTVTHTKIVNFYCLGSGDRVNSQWKPSFQFIANSGGAYLYKYSNLQTSSSSLTAGMRHSGVAFNGNGNTFTDAVRVIEGLASYREDGCSVSNATGNGIRLREVFSPWFFMPGTYNIDASGAQGVVYIDQIYNSNSSLNVNDFRWIMGHCEANKGPYFYGHSNSNLDGFELTNTKFEWGLASIPTGGPWSVIKLLAGSRIQIHDNTYTNFNNANKYSALWEIGTSGSGAEFEIYGNDYANVDASTNDLKSSGNARGECFSNRCFSSSNVVPTLSNTSTKIIKYEPALNLDTGRVVYGSDNSKRMLRMFSRASAAGWGFVSIHEFATDFAASALTADASARNMQGTVLQTGTGASAGIANVPIYLFTGYPEPLRVGVRAKSASGAGTIALIINSTTLAEQTIASTYAVYWFDVTKAQLAVMGDGSDSFKFQTGASNTEAVYVDGLYFVPKTLATPDTATNIASKTATINTQGKEQGSFVYDTTNHRIMVADGGTSTSLWYIADGSGSVTPA